MREARLEPQHKETGLKAGFNNMVFIPFRQPGLSFSIQSMKSIFSKWKLYSHHTGVLERGTYTTLSRKLHFWRNERPCLFWAHLSPTSSSMWKKQSLISDIPKYVHYIYFFAYLLAVGKVQVLAIFPPPVLETNWAPKTRLFFWPLGVFCRLL